MYRYDVDCCLEPYLFSRFVRQFGFDQLYIGNPNPRLGYMGSMIDGARAWRYLIAGYTRARFCMPHRILTLLTSLCFPSGARCPMNVHLHTTGLCYCSLDTSIITLAQRVESTGTRGDRSINSSCSRRLLTISSLFKE